MQVRNDPRVGTELGGYRIESLLGRGGMGVVYRAHDLALDRNVALKVLAPDLAEDERFRERFLRESKLAAALDHPAIVPIYDAGEIDGQLFIAMRLVEGTDLKRLLAEEGLLESERALGLLAPVADALDAAHEHGLLHRDVKPSNVLIDRRGHCYLADFGLSRRMTDQAAAPGGEPSLGTVDYVAPEQIRGGRLDGRADLYSLGCLLYECLAGRPPFTGGSDTAIVFAHLEMEPPTLPGLEPVIEKALAKEPDDRYQSGNELIAAAREALGIARPRPARLLIAVSALALAVTASALLALFLTGLLGADAESAQSDPDADSLIRIDPGTNEVVSTTPVGRDASSVAASGRHVWVTSFTDGTLLRLDPETRDVLTIPVGQGPVDVAAAAGSVLVVADEDNGLVSVDPVAGSVGFTVRLPAVVGGSLAVAAGESSDPWFADPARGVVGRVRASVSGGETFDEIEIAADEKSFLTRYQDFDDMALGHGAIWVVGDSFGRTVWRLDLRARRVVATIPLSFAPGSIAAGAGAIWVTSPLDDVVLRIDPATNRATAAIAVPAGVVGIAAGDEGLWVASAIAGVVSRIDPETSSIIAQVPISGTPTDVAVGAGGVWVTVADPAPTVPAGSIGVGVLADCRGPYGGHYEDSVAGAVSVLRQHGGRRAGPAVTDGVVDARIGNKPVTLALGCADGTAGTALREARRLVEQVGVHVLIGPTAASEEVALQEYARRRPEVAFVNGQAGAQVLDPALNSFSFLPDSAQWMAGLGAYAYHELGWRRAATVGDLDEIFFHWPQVAGFIAEFCSLGGTIDTRVWVPRGTDDYSATIARLPERGIDGIVAASGPATVAALASKYTGLSGDASRKLILGTIAFGSNVEPLFKRSPDLRQSQPWPYPLKAKGPRSAWGIPYHDAMEATAQALGALDGDLSESTARFMASLADVQISSLFGSIHLDARRRAVAPIKPAGNENVEHTFGGYFKPTDPLPSPTTPACVRRTPPPWAR